VTLTAGVLLNINGFQLLNNVGIYGFGVQFHTGNNFAQAVVIYSGFQNMDLINIFDDTTCDLSAITITTQTVSALPSILQANTIYELTADQEITSPITFGGDCIAIVGKHPTNQNGKPVITSQNN
jgi:hypothetical protein